MGRETVSNTAVGPIVLVCSQSSPACLLLMWDNVNAVHSLNHFGGKRRNVLRGFMRVLQMGEGLHKAHHLINVYYLGTQRGGCYF